MRRPSRHSPAASSPNTQPRAMQAGVASYDNPTGLEALAVSTQVRRVAALGPREGGAMYIVPGALILIVILIILLA